MPQSLKLDPYFYFQGHFKVISRSQNMSNLSANQLLTFMPNFIKRNALCPKLSQNNHFLVILPQCDQIHVGHRKTVLVICSIHYMDHKMNESFFFVMHISQYSTTPMRFIIVKPHFLCTSGSILIFKQIIHFCVQSTVTGHSYGQ